MHTLCHVPRRTDLSVEDQRVVVHSHRLLVAATRWFSVHANLRRIDLRPTDRFKIGQLYFDHAFRRDEDFPGEG